MFAGVAAGIATLAADARSEITSSGADVSLYKPENGPALNIFVGSHVHEYLTVQGNYVWNRNDVTLTSVRTTDSGPSFYDAPRASSQQAFIGDLLVYFRERRSAIRPYLSAGVGVVRLLSEERAGTLVEKAMGQREALLAATLIYHLMDYVRPRRLGVIGGADAILRVAVGLDVSLGGHWGARYSFSEGLSSNPISAQLSPPGQRSLANFQNLFGVVRSF